MKTNNSTFFRTAFLLLFFPFLLALSGCDKDDDLNVFTDARDGQTYAIVTIGAQTWMAENLNYIPSSGNSWCYDDDAGNCNTYGRLYDWNTAKTAAPDGWRLPTNADWATLVNFLGGETVAGGPLKEAGLTHWTAPNTGADNSSGFTALPGGGRLSSMFLTINDQAFFWTSTEQAPDRAWARILGRDNTDAPAINSIQEQGYSVRCIMN